jgi:glycolate oxidase
MTAAAGVNPMLLEALGRGIPSERLVVDADVLAGLSHDEAEWAPAGRAAAALRARTEAEVRHAITVCADLRVPVVARGAGTGLSGGANAVEGCLVLDLSTMNPDVLTREVGRGATSLY